jgi:hypothetical protein
MPPLAARWIWRLPLAPQERRRFTRLPFALPVSRLRGAGLVEHQTVDVSAAGCALTTRELLPPGSRVSLVLRDPENAVRAYVEADVIRTQSTEDGRAYVAGLALLNPSGADWRALLLYLMMCRDGRRLAPRLSLRSQALWAPHGRLDGKPIELRDLSVGGAQVSGPEVPESGEEGDVTFVNVEDGGFVHVPSRAVWSRHTASEDRAGLSFEPDGGAQARVARAVSAFVFAPLRVSPGPASAHFVVGSFEVVEPLAQGSTYEVYRGRGIGGPFKGRDVALKRLDPSGAARPNLVERFLAEADLGRILPSQFIAPVLTAFAVGDERWMAAEWVEGTTLASMLEEWSAAGRLPPVRGVLDIFAQVLAGLGEAHQFRGGVSHGHLDASQILIAPGGQVKLIGFLGDPRHAPASDIFQAAALLYRALGGRPPFEANSAEHYAALVRAGPRPLRMLNADVPESVEALVHGALRYEPERRPASATAFARALATAREEK